MIKSIPMRGLAFLIPFIIPLIVANAGLITASPSVATMDYDAFANQALTLVNQRRVKAGCTSLRTVPKLQDPAERQSQDQAARNSLGHIGMDTGLSVARSANGRLYWTQTFGG
jgi:uncharacterized protein YkwD